MSTDPITTEIIRNAFLAAAQDMRVALTRSAFSPVIYEMKDCSVALFNEKAELLGQAPGLPFFLGALSEVVRVVIDHVGLDGFDAGDVFILNDPYLTGSHLNDVDIISPVIWQDQVVGFSASRAHWRDIGGRDAAYTIDITSIYQEGLRLGPVRIVKAGHVLDDVVDILRRQSRLPILLVGDLHAQIAACRMGEQRYRAILDRFGLETVRSSMAAVFEATATLEREAIRSIPNGVYTAEGCQDDDFVTAEPSWVRVRVTVEDERIHVDTSGSSAQRQGATNCGLVQTISAIRLAYKFLVAPQAGVTGGSFRGLETTIEPGSIFAAQEPAACLQYGTHTMLLVDLIQKALAPAIPEQVAAGLPGDAWNVVIVRRGPDRRVRAAWAESTAGGWGANAHADGESAVIHSAAGDFRNFPVESMENKYPLLIHGYSVGVDSGGPGKYRGGLNIVREYEIRGDGCDLTLWFERTKTPSWGLFGGGQGSVPGVLIQPGEPGERRLRKVNHLPVSPGTRFRVFTGGGGGYGPAWERDPARVREDIVDGYVSRQAAEELYGVCFLESTNEIDAEATRQLRSRIAGRAP
ncbi:MAG: hydantoinase B/oxoprolinase family protein [Anaerolineae bacterium]